VANVRGRDLIDAVAFVRDSYGQTGSEAVLSQLPVELQVVFGRPLREAGWYALDVLVSYLMTAKRVLAPEDPDFFRRQGYYAGQHQKAAFLGAMVATPEMRVKMASTVWRMYYDVGRLEVVGDRPDTAGGRIHDFPTTPELCERFRGIWEGIASSAEHAVIAIETHCVGRGNPFCEFQLRSRD